MTLIPSKIEPGAVTTAKTNAVAVYCASSFGHNAVYQKAAVSLGRALARVGRPLVYGGGRKGIMGVVSSAVIEAGGEVTGILPYAMLAAGGEKEQGEGELKAKIASGAYFGGKNRKNETTIVVDTMHERKLEMAKRSCGFITLPGGFGTLEELFEVTTWSQLGIHNKPVIVINVLGFYNVLRQLIQTSVREGFIKVENESMMLFVDGPEDLSAHEDFDWGQAALEKLEQWHGKRNESLTYDWTKRKSTEGEGTSLAAS